MVVAMVGCTVYKFARHMQLGGHKVKINMERLTESTAERRIVLLLTSRCSRQLFP